MAQAIRSSLSNSNAQNKHILSVRSKEERKDNVKENEAAKAIPRTNVYDCDCACALLREYECTCVRVRVRTYTSTSVRVRVCACVRERIVNTGAALDG